MEYFVATTLAALILGAARVWAALIAKPPAT